MKAARSLFLCLLAAAAAQAGNDTAGDSTRKPAPQVWHRLAHFRSLAEFNDFRTRARQVARANGAWWASTPFDGQAGPMVAQAAPAGNMAVAPCDPPVKDCEEQSAEMLEQVIVTGLRGALRASVQYSMASITNNQEGGVEEGDIVKAFDRFIVVL